MCAEIGSVKKRPVRRTVLVPYLPIEYNMSLKLSKPFSGIGKYFTIFFPYLPEYLYASEIFVEPEHYIGVAILTFFVYMIFLNLCAFVLHVGSILNQEEKNILLMLQLPLSTFISGVIAFQVMNYPVVKAKKRAWQTERYIAPMLRHATVEVRSGATIFEALQDIAKADYGVISKDCTEIVNAVNSGLSFEEAIEYIVLKTKSESFRRVLLQIENAISSGANMGDVLVQLSRTYFQEQQIKIQKYGKDLEFYSRLFMMITVILPVMFSIIISMTAIMPLVNLNTKMLYFVLGIVLFFQIMFITFAKEQRPPIYD